MEDLSGNSFVMLCGKPHRVQAWYELTNHFDLSVEHTHDIAVKLELRSERTSLYALFHNRLPGRLSG